MRPPDRFTCEDMFRRLDDFLDRSLSPEEEARIQEHLELCESCAREYQFEESLLSGLRRKLRSTEAPEGLKQRISSLLERTEKKG